MRSSSDTPRLRLRPPGGASPHRRTRQGLLRLASPRLPRGRGEERALRATGRCSARRSDRRAVAPRGASPNQAESPVNALPHGTAAGTDARRGVVDDPFPGPRGPVVASRAGSILASASIRAAVAPQRVPRTDLLSCRQSTVAARLRLWRSCADVPGTRDDRRPYPTSSSSSFASRS